MPDQNQPLNFEDIYQKYHRRIILYLLRITGDMEEAEDLSQEVFIKVNNNLDKFEGRSSLATWIYKIATNVSNDRHRSAYFRKEKSRTLTEGYQEEYTDENKDWNKNTGTEPDKHLADKEMNACINRYIYDLNENYRTVLILSEYEGLKNQEIADILGLSLDTVKIRIHRGRSQLRKRMEQGCEITPDEDRGLFCDEK